MSPKYRESSTHGLSNRAWELCSGAGKTVLVRPKRLLCLYSTVPHTGVSRAAPQQRKCRSVASASSVSKRFSMHSEGTLHSEAQLGSLAISLHGIAGLLSDAQGQVKWYRGINSNLYTSSEVYAYAYSSVAHSHATFQAEDGLTMAFAL